MNIYTNTRRAKQRKNRHYVGIMINVALFLIIVFALLLTVTFRLSPQAANSPILLVGMAILSMIIGLLAGNQLTKLPAPHEAINDALKGLSRDNTIYHYHLPAEHVLFSETGVFTIIAMPQDTTVTTTEHGFKSQDSFLKKLVRFFLQMSLGDPFYDAQRSKQRLLAWLTEHFPERQLLVQPLVVFTNPHASISFLHATDIPVLYADRRKPSLKAYVRSYTGQGLTSQDIAAINTLLAIADEQS